MKQCQKRSLAVPVKREVLLLDESNLKQLHINCGYSNILKEYECNQCTFENDLKVNLKDHLNVAHKHSKIRYDMRHILMNYSCTNCQFGTHSLLVFLKHSYNNKCVKQNMELKATKKPKRDLALRCQVCCYLFKHKQHLSRHMSAKHAKPEDIKWFECGHCFYKAKRKSHLDKHLLSKHTNADEGQWLECPNCGLKTRHKSTLRRHIRDKHSDVQCFTCKLCHFETKYKYNLKEHLMRKHKL